MISSKHDNKISPPNIDDGRVYQFASHYYIGGFILIDLFLQCNVSSIVPKILTTQEIEPSL
jgi:hypothetical protein